MKSTRVMFAAVTLGLFGAVAVSPVGAQVRNPHKGVAVTPQQQQQRVQEQRQRTTEYQHNLDDHIRQAQAHAAQLQQARRSAAYQAQQQYLANLRAQQTAARAARDYDRDPYFTTPMSYRYRANGVVRETNQYGADLLRTAVSDGYQQGYVAGRADRQDGAPNNYRAAYAYQDANYGYNGMYVAQSDYNYYFRQGFQRGYQDGFASTTRYGSFTNGTASILGSVLSGILGLTTIH